ncbi:MAG: CARDB domain-containing protein [Candidatus Micrarchaeia archaeon]
MAFAGTVVLTGTCADVVKNSTVNFSIANSGNDSAYHLIVNPYISGANVIGNYSIARLNPGSAANFAVRLSNITAKGTYVDYFVVDYQQGNSFFSAMFSCWLEFGVSATSPIYLNSYFLYANSSVGLVNVSVMNAGTSLINATISLLVPAYVHVIGAASKQLTLVPGNVSHLQFKIDAKGMDGVSFDGAVYASYSRNGINFATQPSIFTFKPYSSGFSVSKLIVYGAIAFILLFAIFVLFTALKNMRNAKSQRHQEGV